MQIHPERTTAERDIQIYFYTFICSFRRPMTCINFSNNEKYTHKHKSSLNLDIKDIMIKKTELLKVPDVQTQIFPEDALNFNI